MHFDCQFKSYNFLSSPQRLLSCATSVQQWILLHLIILNTREVWKEGWRPTFLREADNSVQCVRQTCLSGLLGQGNFLKLGRWAEPYVNDLDCLSIGRCIRCMYLCVSISMCFDRYHFGTGKIIMYQSIPSFVTGHDLANEEVIMKRKIKTRRNAKTVFLFPIRVGTISTLYSDLLEDVHLAIFLLSFASLRPWNK